MVRQEEERLRREKEEKDERERERLMRLEVRETFVSLMLYMSDDVDVNHGRIIMLMHLG